MRRFLSRSSITNRLVGLLFLSVVVPGVGLAWYGVQAVLQEDTLYEATLRERAQAMAAFLHRDLGDRMGRMLASLDAAAEEGGARWVTDPASAAARVEQAEPLASGVLLLDPADELRFPTRAATGLFARRSGQARDSAYLQPLLSAGEELEFRARDPAGAAVAYGAAIANIPGQRGRGIARLARARCLLKAGSVAAARDAFDELALLHVGDRDLHDFPLDLLARYQAAAATLSLGDADDAASRLLALLETLESEPWTYGGYGETALAARSLDLLASQELSPALRVDEPPRLDALRARLGTTARLQSRQATILGVLPSLTADIGRAGRGTGFELASIDDAEGSLLFAHRWVVHRNQSRRLVIPLDQESLRQELEGSLSTAARANPEFATQLVLADPTDTTPLGQGFRVVHLLDPWLPGYALVVSRGEGVLGSTRKQQRIVRVGMIAALLIVILVGIVVISRVVSREVEIARLKSDFVSSVSHELRTPLTTIRIMAEMLALGAVPSGEKQAEYHRNIVSEAERLTRLINNVLDFARIEEGRKKFKFGMGDIGGAVFEVERITGDYVRKEGFTLTTSVEEGLPPTAFDRDAVIQALINLMSNAVKYSGEDKRIEMGVELQRDSIVLAVTDHGPGIDPKEIPHLFEKFYRGGDHMTREIGGTGLGLSIVNHIVSAHGGRVNVKSKLGEGSRFELILPVQQVSAASGSGRRR